MTKNQPINDGDGVDDGGGEGDANDMSSSSSAADDSCVEPKIVSDGEPRSNGSSPPSSTTVGSFELADDSEKESSSMSLNQLNTNEKLLALAASVAARTSRTGVVPSSTSTGSVTESPHVNHPRVTSYSSLEGALMGSTTIVTKSKIAETKPPEARVRVSRPSPTKTRSTVPRQKGTNSGLRRGKWTVEEEVYVVRVIQDFNSGFLDAPAGTTLRTYLSEKLKCDPMRITKKFTGESCIGKRVFHPAVRTAANSEAIDKAQAELNGLESRWRRRLEMQQRESAKKAAASAAVAQVAAVSTTEPHTSASSSDRHVAQTAAWLDRAKVALEVQGDENDKSTPAALQTRMQEMQRLIREGPVIQQASADLPHILDDAATERSKRMRTTEGDAEALVGFLRTVRASVDSSSSTTRAPPTTD